ncbi:WD40 repeat-like protein [Clavulina sp. PMI_390]|nr:WD40 repeat-like protein [Clavulina sp. PMI_390]
MYKRQRLEWDAETGRLKAELKSALDGNPMPSSHQHPGPPGPHPDERERDRDIRDRDRERYGGPRDSYGPGPGPSAPGSRRGGPDMDVDMMDPRDRDRGDMRRKDKIPKSEPDQFVPSGKPLSSSRPSLPQSSPSHERGPIPYPPTSGPGGPSGSPSLPPISSNGGPPPSNLPPTSSINSLNNGPNNANGNQQLVVVTSDNPLADLEPDQVRPEHKKEGSDWWAIFNPRLPKVLDVNLSLTLTHESVVCCVRFSADGKYLATGCNRTAQIYDTKTGARTVLADEAATKTGDLYIRSVCFSPDGKYLATGAEDKQIRIWDIAKRKIRTLFEGHQQEIYSLDFSRDGKLIVSGSGDKTARIWEMDTGHCKVLEIIEPESIDAGVTSVAISPDGRWVAAGSLDMVVRIWDVATGTLIERLRGHKDSVYSVAFSPDGRGLVSGSLDKSLKYWDIMPMVRAVDNANRAVGGVHGAKNLALRQDGTMASNQQPIPNGKKDGGGETGSSCTVAFTGHKDYVLSVAVSPDGNWIVSGSKDRGVQFWNPKDAQTQLMLQGHKNSVISIDLSPAGGMLATGSGDWQARVCK